MNSEGRIQETEFKDRNEVDYLSEGAKKKGTLLGTFVFIHNWIPNSLILN